ncbi:hypothetical protein Q7689_13050 [Nocardiopsis tropica]|nr:hypothetical protein [Nocardiopsis tropica]
MNIRGVSYHTDHLPAGLAERDMRTVREDLRCTAVLLIGDDVGQLESAAGAALEAALRTSSVIAAAVLVVPMAAVSALLWRHRI